MKGRNSEFTPPQLVIEYVLNRRHQQITLSAVGCHEKHIPHQECFTDPGVDESVCNGAITSREARQIFNSHNIPSTVDLLAFPALFVAGLEKAAEFLLHQFPMVRIQGGICFTQFLTID